MFVNLSCRRKQGTTDKLAVTDTVERREGREEKRPGAKQEEAEEEGEEGSSSSEVGEVKVWPLLSLFDD